MANKKGLCEEIEGKIKDLELEISDLKKSLPTCQETPADTIPIEELRTELEQLKATLSAESKANHKEISGLEKEVAETKGSGWVEYMWAKPGEKEPSPKKSFVKKVPGENLYVGAGFYVNKISRAE